MIRLYVQINPTRAYVRDAVVVAVAERCGVGVVY